jgi:hypothetical protein
MGHLLWEIGAILPEMGGKNQKSFHLDKRSAGRLDAGEENVEEKAH